MGLFGLLKVRNPAPIELPVDSSIQHLPFRTGNSSDGRMAAKLRADLESIAGEIPNRKAMFDGVTEAMTNVLHHAYLHRISQLIAFCSEKSFIFGDTGIENSLIFFREAVMGPGFETRTRSPDIDRIRVILRAGTDLMIKVRGARRRLLGLI
jgi:hypothetical protein